MLSEIENSSSSNESSYFLWITEERNKEDDSSVKGIHLIVTDGETFWKNPSIIDYSCKPKNRSIEDDDFMNRVVSSLKNEKNKDGRDKYMVSFTMNNKDKESDNLNLKIFSESNRVSTMKLLLLDIQLEKVHNNKIALLSMLSNVSLSFSELSTQLHDSRVLNNELERDIHELVNDIDNHEVYNKNIEFEVLEKSLLLLLDNASSTEELSRKRKYHNAC